MPQKPRRKNKKKEKKPMLNDSLLCYLTPEAQESYDYLVIQCGLDSDLALSVLEATLEDSAIFSIPEED